MPRRKRWTLRVVFVLVCALLAYVASYAVVSRRGFAAADQHGFEGFYFLEPEDTDRWRWMNYSLVTLYRPLIWVDCAIGTGRAPASEPLWRITP